MSNKNWFKNLIFEDSESENQEQQEKASSDAPAAPEKGTKKTPVSNLPQSEPLDASTIIGKVDQNLLNKLVSVLDTQPAEGIDYLKYKKSVDSLKDFQPEENVRFTTAYVTLKATNPALTKESLLQTVDQYIALMEQERKTGMEQLRNLRAKSVDSKEANIADAVMRLEKLKEEINRLTLYISNTNEEVFQKKNEYALQEANFNATVNTIVNQLKSDRTKIETIIK